MKSDPLAEKAFESLHKSGPHKRGTLIVAVKNDATPLHEGAEPAPSGDHEEREDQIISQMKGLVQQMAQLIEEFEASQAQEEQSAAPAEGGEPPAE